MDAAKLAEVLNRLTRYSMVSNGYLGDTLDPDDFGDYISVDDLAAALGLQLGQYGYGEFRAKAVDK